MVSALRRVTSTGRVMRSAAAVFVNAKQISVAKSQENLCTRWVVAARARIKASAIGTLQGSTSRLTDITRPPSRLKRMTVVVCGSLGVGG